MADSSSPATPPSESAPSGLSGAPQCHADVIRLWPSVAAYAADTSQKPGTARMQAQRNSIPSSVWASVATAAQARGFGGVTLASLAAMARPRKPYAVAAAPGETPPVPMGSANA